MMETEIPESIRKHLDVFLNLHGGKQCVLLDFDECLVTDHISRLVTLEFSEHYNEYLDFKDTSVAGIRNLLRLYVGINYNQIWNTCKNKANQIRFRPYVLQLFRQLNELDIPIIIISSGLGLAIDAKFFKYRNISFDKFACELNFDDQGVCIAPMEIINDLLKGQIALAIANSGKFKSVYSVGHSQGDIQMLRNTTGICLRGEQNAEAVATYIVGNFYEVINIICQS